MSNKKTRFLLKKEFASLAKVDASMVSKMVKSGKIKLFLKDGKEKIDLKEKLTIEYLIKRKEKVPSIEFEIPTQTEGESQESIPVGTLSINPTPEELVNYSPTDLSRLKSIGEIRRKDQETAVRRGELIERSTVGEILLKIFDLDEKHLLKLGDNVASQAAAIMGISDIPKTRKLADFLNDQVKESLQRSKKEAEEILLNLAN